MADAHNGRHYDPEILALIERAEAAILRSQQVIARMDKLARALANAVQRSDRRFATQDIRPPDDRQDSIPPITAD